HDVIEIGQPFLEPRFGPQPLILLQTLVRRDGQGRPRVEGVHKRAWGFTTLLEDFGVACLDLALPFGVNRSIAQWHTVVRRALEDGGWGHVLGNSRDELDGAGPGADAPPPLASDLQAILWPSAGVTPGALEALHPRKVRHKMRRQPPNRRDHKWRLRPVAFRRVDLPAMLALVVDRRGDLRMQLDVSAQVKLVRDIIEVALVLRLAGIMFFPVPFLQEFLREGIAVGVTLRVEARARVAIPIPGAADA